MNIEYFKIDSVYGIKFYNCNKNPIKYLQGLLQQEKLFYPVLFRNLLYAQKN